MTNPHSGPDVPVRPLDPWSGAGAPHTPYNLVIALIALVQLINTADFMLVGVALPSIGRDLAVSNTLAGWVVSINALTYAGFVMLGGRLSDLIGQRRCTIFGLALFSLGSTLAFLSPRIEFLLAARAIQGVGNAIMCPATFAMLNTLLPPGPIRNRGYGVYGITQGLSTLVGAGLGGVFTTAFGWRSVFLLTLPFALSAIAIAFLAVPKASAHRTRRALDYWGAVLITGSTTLLILGLSSLHRPGWIGAPDGAGSLVAGAALLAVFLLVEGRLKDPLVPLKMFSFPAVMTSNLAIGCGVAATTGLMLLVNLYMQRVLGYSAMQAGFGIIPFAVGGIIGGQCLGLFLSRFSIRANALTGFGIYLAGILFFGSLSSTDGYLAHIGPGLAVAGFSSVFGLLAAMARATAAVPHDDQGAASGIVYVSQKLGRAVGTSVALTVLAACAAQQLDIVVSYRVSFVALGGLLALALLGLALPTRPVATADIVPLRPRASGAGEA